LRELYQFARKQIIRLVRSAGPLADKVLGLLLLKGRALAGSLTKPPENSVHSEV